MAEIRKEKSPIVLIAIIVILSYYLSNTILSKHYLPAIFYIVIIPFLLIAITNFEFSLLLLFFLSVVYSPLKDVSASLFIFMGIDIYFLWLLSVWLAKKIFTGVLFLSIPPLFRVMLLFYVFIIAMGVVNPEATMIQTLGGIRAWLQFTPLYFIGYEICANEKNFWRAINLFIFMGIITSIYGIIQYIVGPAYFQNISEIAAQRHFNIYYATSSGEVEFRVYSTFVQAGAFGSFLVFFLLFVVYE